MKRCLPAILLALAFFCQSCSAKKFSAEPLSDATFAAMQGLSYKEGCPVPRESLRLLHLSYIDFEGRSRTGQMVCNKAIADDLLEIFEALYDAHYPIASIRLVDEFGADDERSMQADNSSCFNFRPVSGSRTLSKHSYGLAVDINPFENPYVRTRDGKTTVEPAGAEKYVDRTGGLEHMIDADDLCCRLFKEHGFVWGGDWKSVKDYQHFEKTL